MAGGVSSKTVQETEKGWFCLKHLSGRKENLTNGLKTCAEETTIV